MLLFGHTGLTFGVTLLVSGATRLPNSRLAALGRLAARIDLRLLLLASLLPDLVDKPLGHYVLADLFGTGRIFTHTLLFFVIISGLGIWAYWRGHLWPLTLALGSGSHLVLDAMWRDPVTLFWPAYGIQFPAATFEGSYLELLWYALTHYSEVYIPEIVGLLVFVFVGLRLSRRRQVLAFLRRGRLP